MRGAVLSVHRAANVGLPGLYGTRSYRDEEAEATLSNHLFDLSRIASFPILPNARAANATAAPPGCPAVPASRAYSDGAWRSRDAFKTRAETDKRFLLICALTILRFTCQLSRVCCCVHGFSRCKLPGAQPWGVP